MSNELKGILKVIQPTEFGTSKNGNQWQKKIFVIETQGQYPKLSAFEVMKPDICSLIDTFNIGDELNVSFEIESREWQGKYFTSARAWKIASKSQSRPVQNTPAPAAIPEPFDTIATEQTDDLPF